jgi:hypothetical protein
MNNKQKHFLSLRAELADDGNPKVLSAWDALTNAEQAELAGDSDYAFGLLTWQSQLAESFCTEHRACIAQMTDAEIMAAVRRARRA